MPELPPLAFLDTETTGLDLDDHVWDFAAIIREPGAPDYEWQTYVDHDPFRASRLPEPFQSDYQRRYDPRRSISPADLTARMMVVLQRCLIVGAVPAFDTTRLELLMRRAGWTGLVPWHYQIVDVETLTLGYLRGAERRVPTDQVGHSKPERIPTPPWDSDALTAMVGATSTDRHTALGDARWARDAFDRVNPWPEYERVHIDAISVPGR